MKQLILFLKGAFMGASMLIPGVSGGTMAIILGIYDKLIKAVSNFLHSPKKNFFYLGIVALGGMIGMLLFSKALLHLTELYRMPMMYLFLGAVIGSIPLLCTKAKVKSFSFSVFFFPAVGLAIILLLNSLSSEMVAFSTLTGTVKTLVIIAAGLIAAIALVLPGISVSYMLLILGMYEPALTAIEHLDFTFLIPLGLSILAGIFLSTKGLSYCMEKHTQKTFLIIIGFVLGSVPEVFPGLPVGNDILFCLLTLLLGIAAILALSRYAND